MLREEKKLLQVTYLPEANAVNVQWAVKIYRGDQLLTETYERVSYGPATVNQFIEEIPNGLSLALAFGWNT